MQKIGFARRHSSDWAATVMVTVMATVMATVIGRRRRNVAVVTVMATATGRPR